MIILLTLRTYSTPNNLFEINGLSQLYLTQKEERKKSYTVDAVSWCYWNKLTVCISKRKRNFFALHHSSLPLIMASCCFLKPLIARYDTFSSSQSHISCIRSQSHNQGGAAGHCVFFSQHDSVMQSATFTKSTTLPLCSYQPTRICAWWVRTS